jgi:CDP-glucose 4,6-dehydratase
MINNNNLIDASFWRNKKVFLTGHTGFKGGWLSTWLSEMGSNVTGYSLLPNTEPSFYSKLNVSSIITESIIGDIRDFNNLKNKIMKSQPEIIFHLAAQPLVRSSYYDPITTYSTNVMGTVNLLQIIRDVSSVKVVVVVTTDKCYENNNWVWGYRESDPLGGSDPYSNSKACCELVVDAFRKSYFMSLPRSEGLAISTARAGNVIGGGDWSNDRLLPDAFHHFEKDKPLPIRNPNAVRPWQHVLEPLSGYLTLAEAMYNNQDAFSSAWNFGPYDDDCKSVREVVNTVIDNWPTAASWFKDETNQPHEAQLLKLDCSKAHTSLNWKPKWSLQIAVSKSVSWHQAQNNNQDMLTYTINQINEYIST